MLKRIFSLLIRLLKFLIPLGAALLLVPRLVTAFNARARLFQVNSAPASRVAIVFGAGLRRDGSPTPVLSDRVATAAELYFAGKVEKLLMSGDNRFAYYNEPEAMRQYAIQLGVPDAAIVLDYAGRRTYDTCYRARQIFGVTEAILVTQAFHLPRALYLCDNLGVNAAGVSADQRRYFLSSQLSWNLRELFATLNALVEIHLTHPVPVLGQFEPIFPASQ